MAKGKMELTRREVLAGSAASLVVTAAGEAHAAEKQAVNEKAINQKKAEVLEVQAPDASRMGTRQVPEYVSDRELESWTLDVLSALDEGLALVKVFDMAGSRTKNAHLLKFSADVPDLIGQKGLLLSDAMRANRHIFDRNYVTTVRFGELYGELDSALRKWLAAQAKRRAG